MAKIMVVGAGLYGATCAHILSRAGNTVHVFDERDHVAGNCHSHDHKGVCVHTYGPHVFNTNNKKVWDFVGSVAELVPHPYQVLAKAGSFYYSFPINLMTLYQMYGTTDTKILKSVIDADMSRYSTIDAEANAENFMLKSVGKAIYSKFFKHYTAMQWGRPANKLPASIVKRIPIRWTYDSRYHNSLYCGFPKNGYTNLVGRLLEGSSVSLGVKVDSDTIVKNTEKYDRIFYSGSIDELFGYRMGVLGYRTIVAEKVELKQNPSIPLRHGVAQTNFVGKVEKHTRMIVHNLLEPWTSHHGKPCVITLEKPEDWTPESSTVRMYPIRIPENTSILKPYEDMSKNLEHVTVGGRLGKYMYLDMDATVAMAINHSTEFLRCP